MTLNKKIAAAAVCLVLPITSEAAPLTAGIYEVYDIEQPYKNPDWDPGDEYRSLWNPNDDKLVEGGGASRLWSFSDAYFDYDGLGNGGTLSASATNLGNSDLTFDVSLSFSDAVADGRNGFCDFYTGDTFANPGTKVCRDDVTFNADWTYLTFAGGTLSGTGSVLDGLIWDVFGNETHFPQIGLNGNALVDNGLDGFSMWFTYDQRQDVTSRTVDGITYAINDEGFADINANLRSTGGPSEVPLPAAGWLLLAGLGSAALIRRRRN